MRYIYLFVLLILILPVVAQDAANVLLSPRDAQTGKTLDNLIVYVYEENSTQTYYLEKDQILPLQVNGILSLGVDDLGTPVLDYFSTEEFNYSSTVAYGMYVYPVGELSIEVYDVAGNLLSEIPVIVECGQITYDRVTDQLGDVRIKRVPIGLCNIEVYSGGLVGREYVEITKGNLRDIQVKISVPSKDEGSSGIFIVGLLIISLIGYFTYKKFKISSKTKSAVLNTLALRDRSIVEALIKHETLGFSQLRELVDIPKPTLSRRLVILESKKLILVEKIGRSRRISLSEWYKSQ